MPINVNCTKILGDKCTHPAVPRNFRGLNKFCVLLFPITVDPRIPEGCALQELNIKPKLPPSPPPVIAKKI